MFLKSIKFILVSILFSYQLYGMKPVEVFQSAESEYPNVELQDSESIEGRVDLEESLRNDSRIMWSHTSLNVLVCQSITKIASNMDDASLAGMNQDAYANFVRSARYLGGTDNGFNENVFMTASASGGGLNNANATFFDFIGENAYNNIARLGDGNIGVGYARLREFITTNYPNFAGSLTHLSETDMLDAGGVRICPAVDFPSPGDVGYSGDRVADQVQTFLDGNLMQCRELGMNGAVNLIDQSIVDDLNDIYDPSNIGAEDELLRIELTQTKNQLAKMKKACVKSFLMFIYNGVNDPDSKDKVNAVIFEFLKINETNKELGLD